MIRLILAVAIVACLAFSAEAGPRRNRGRSFNNFSTPVAAKPVELTSLPIATPTAGAPENSTAQGVANWMARTGRVGHCGGNRGYEGCGMAATKDGAYRICCYANMGWRDADVGFAQGSNGMWYCCRRYATR